MVTKTIAETIAAAHFLASEEQVGRLAYAVQEGQAADVAYLRVLLAHMKSRLARTRRGATVNMEALLDQVHDRFYPVVLRALGTEETPAAELQRKATFARSNASTIRYFIRHGGDVRELDLATVTKSGLRSAVQPAAREVEGETKADRAFRRLEERFLKSAKRFAARGDPDTVRQHLEEMITQLEDMLATVGEPEHEEVPAEQPAIVRAQLERRRAGTQPRAA